ncbi:MAG: T9SS type A sorting domain-containing protein [Bacteroidetes bacterium]|nr:T9SS type A sorting domain-containing protein [Bacteroidota bacterium]
MKKLYLFTLLNLFVASSQAQYFQWAKAEGLWAYDYGYGTGLDNAGNLYVAGKYELNAIFSGSTVTNHGTNHDIYLAKYTPSGSLMWVQTGGGTLGDYAHAMYCDGSSAVYTAGEIEGLNAQITFPGSAITLTCVGDNDLYLSKYDLNGTLLWAKSEGWYGSEKALGITADNTGNVYVCGYFTDTTKFNGVQVNGKGNHDIFIAKYNSSGVFQWVKTAGSVGRDEAKGVKCDASGNVYICGMYSNSAYFNAQTTLTCTAGYFDAFVAKYDPSGNMLWIKRGSSDYDDVAWSITMDSQGKIYTAGEFVGYGIFGNQNVTTAGATDAFVACYDASGNEQWVKRAGGSQIDRVRGIGTDGTNLFITGQFGSTASFGSQSVTSADSSDIFVSAMDNTGSFLWTATVGGPADSLETLGYESGNSVIGDASGNVYATGSLLNGGVFSGFNVPHYTRTDAFVTKLNSTPQGIRENYLKENIAIYPNPSNGIFNLDVSRYPNETLEVTTYNSMGQKVASVIHKPSSSINVDLVSQPNGIYFVEIKTTSRVVDKQKIIVQH